MKLLLACMVCLAFGYSAAETVECINCYEGDPKLYAAASLVLLQTETAVPFKECLKGDNITDSEVTKVDTNQYNCTKLKFSGTSNNQDYCLTLRTYAADIKCRIIENLVQHVEVMNTNGFNFKEVDFECYHCSENKCNSAS